MLIGMKTPPMDPKKNAVEKSESNRSRRKVLQQQFEEDYQQALVHIREKILKVEGPDMKEAIQDSFRQWYMEHKRIFGKFPEFPEDEVWQTPGFQFIPAIEGQAAPVESAEGEKEAPKEEEPKEKKKGDKKGKGEEVILLFKHSLSKYRKKQIQINSNLMILHS